MGFGSENFRWNTYLIDGEIGDFLLHFLGLFLVLGCSLLEIEQLLLFLFVLFEQMRYPIFSGVLPYFLVLFVSSISISSIGIPGSNSF